MSDSTDSNDEATQVFPEGYEPSDEISSTDATVPQIKTGDQKVGKTDVFDQIEAEDDTYLGQTLGHYHILSKLGQGGFGAVYKARDIKLDRHAAVKFLSAPMNSDYSKLFKREAKILANLSKNGNIVQIYTWGEYRGCNYMALEYMDGSVEDQLKNNPDGLPLKDALEIIANCCEALEYAHDQGVLHRDIKPANILIDSKTKQTKLCDFGLARFYNKGIDSATQTIAGSPPFMPIEQISGKTLDERSDIYSLGVTLYQLLSGQLPFSGDSQYEIMEKIRSGKGEQLTSHRDGLPKIVYDIVKKARARKPDDRFQNATEFKDALRRTIHAIEETGSADSARLDPVKKPAWVKYAVAAGVTACITIVGIGGFFSGRSGSDSGTTTVLAETKNLIEQSEYSKAETRLRKFMEPFGGTEADYQEAAYQLAYALQRSGQNTEAQTVSELITDPAMEREIDAVLAHALDREASRAQLQANADAVPDSYSVVLLAMLDLASSQHRDVISRLEKFDSSHLNFNWQKHTALQTLGQAYFASNKFDSASTTFNELRGVSNANVAGRAAEFAEIIEARVRNEEKAVLMQYADELSDAIDDNGSYDSWTSRPLRVSVLDAKVQESMTGRVLEEGLNEFFPFYLNAALANGTGRPISILDRVHLDEVLAEKNLISKVGAEDEKGDILSGIFGVRYIVKPEFSSFKDDQLVSFSITSVASGEQIFMEEDLNLPPHNSDRAAWKAWIRELESMIRAKLTSSYRLQGILASDSDGLTLNIGSTVGVSEGMQFTVHNEPHGAKVGDYIVRVVGDISDNKCRVEPVGFEPKTAKDGWYVQEKA